MLLCSWKPCRTPQPWLLVSLLALGGNSVSEAEAGGEEPGALAASLVSRHGSTQALPSFLRFRFPRRGGGMRAMTHLAEPRNAHPVLRGLPGSSVL